SYAIPDGAIGADGRKVKCRKCAHVWFTKDSDLIDPNEVIDEPTAANRDEDADNEITDPANKEADTETTSEIADEFTAALQSGPDEDDPEDDKEWGTDAEHVDSYESITPKPIDKDATDKSSRKDLFKTKHARIAAIAAAFIIFSGSTFVFRTQIVRILPATADLFAVIGYPVNLRGLEFQNVTFKRDFENGLPVLSIHGDVVNITSKRVLIPKLRFALRDEEAREIYYWSGVINQESLEPGRTIPFTTRLSSPPVTARNIMVRFTDRVSG
ncbi:MAG: hypothetical protein K8F25_15925, partial [Fimbriimonadaceae bacterium]|nr:hypothetical protein [Alphaproteobacteria bacterium]